LNATKKVSGFKAQNTKVIFTREQQVLKPLDDDPFKSVLKTAIAIILGNASMSIGFNLYAICGV